MPRPAHTSNRARHFMVAFSSGCLTFAEGGERVRTPFSRSENCPCPAPPVSTGERMAIRCSWPRISICNVHCPAACFRNLGGVIASVSQIWSHPRARIRPRAGSPSGPPNTVLTVSSETGLLLCIRLPCKAGARTNKALAEVAKSGRLQHGRFLWLCLLKVLGR